MSRNIIIRPFEAVDYFSCVQAMRTFTLERTETTDDEIWLVEHPPIITQGLAGKPEHILDAGDIPVVQTERGGQVTYHGPGQVVAYVLVDIKRRGMMIRDLVNRMEQAVIAHLSTQNIAATRKAGAPGVYIAPPHPQAGSKIASLGLKVSRGRTFHGLAFNANMDLEPFKRINPCGMPGLTVTDLQTLTGGVDVAEQATSLGQILKASIKQD